MLEDWFELKDSLENRISSLEKRADGEKTENQITSQADGERKVG